ncbi:MAG: DUF4349 domain-containing protein [Chloroflexi bacterium]|nr:DUF4349 domain-containing protein [Chloroflexota bacterium]
MKKLFTLILFALALSIAACASAPTARSIAPSIGGVPQPAPAAPPMAESFAADATGDQQKGAPAAAPVPDRMIVRTVNMNLEVADSEKAVTDINAIVAQYKGYVAATNLRRNARNRLGGSITLRIPAESLDAALKQIKAAGLQVLTENSNANDVTDRYTDLGAQLKNLEAAEVELRKLFESVREKSGKADEILAVYNRLTQIRQQIEQIKGQINVIEKTSTLATVTIELTQHEDVDIVDSNRWLPDRTAREALRALVQALQGIANLIIWFALFVLPILLVALTPLLLFAAIVRAVWRRRAKRAMSV